MLTSQHKQTCHEILTLLEMMQGFELLFVECNPPILQQQLEHYLEEHDPHFRWIKIRLAQAIENLREELLGWQLPFDTRIVLSVSGLEHSIRGDQESATVIARLNVARDILPHQLPCPLLLWLPHYALQHVVRFAPDLWSWRAGVFYFEMPEETAQPERILQSGTPADSYSKIFKEGEIAFLTPIVETFDPTTASRRELKKHTENVFRLAQYHYRLGHFNEALGLFQRAEGFYRQIQDQPMLAACYNEIGLIHDSRGEWERALSYYLKSEQFILEVGDWAGLGATYNNIGGIYDNKGNRDRALDYYLKAEQIQLEVGDRAGLGATYNNIGSIYENTGDWDQALVYYRKAEAIIMEVGDRASLGPTYNNIGLIYSNKGDQNRSLDYYRKSEHIRIEVGDRAGLAFTYFYIGTLYLENNEKERAHEYLILAGYLAITLGMKHELSQMKWALQPIIDEFGEAWFLELGKRLCEERGL